MADVRPSPPSQLLHPPPAKNHAPLRMHTKTKETAGLGQKRRAFRNACRLRLIPAAMSISISSLRQIVPSVPSNPSLLHCLQHTTHKIRRAVLNGREGRKGRGSGGVDRHQRPQVVARPAATASQEPLPSGRCRAAAAPPRAPQTTSAQPLRPRTAQPARTAVRRAGRRVAATLPRPLRAWRRSAIIPV